MVMDGHRPPAKVLADTPLVTVATCNLDQWALDFDGNLERTMRSIREAKRQGARYRLGPELELSGYGCEDHFHEGDTYTHCVESLAELLESDVTEDILCDIGMPVLHKSVRYNCRMFCLNHKILLIRPKLFLADSGNYRENRHFTSWKKYMTIEDHWLDPLLQRVTGQTCVPFGQGCVTTMDTMVAAETCEELWTPRSPHVDQSLAGVEIHGNGSGSHHQLRKLDQRVSYMLSATQKCGGVYLYANQQGCDGGRLYFDGGAVIICNGKLLAQASQFSLKDVEVITATINLDDIRAYRSSTSSLMEQSSAQESLPQILAEGFQLTSKGATHRSHPPTPERPLRVHSPEEECGMGPACWLWDYLRRSGASGFFLPLSGGADSSSVAAIVGVMCDMALAAARGGNERVASDVRRIMGLGERDGIPEDPQALVNCVLHTTYMGTDNSSKATQSRAARLSEQLGAYHCSITIDTIVAAVVGVFQALTGKVPRYVSHGGSNAEDLALQNIQARLRMVMAYLLAQLLPWVRGRSGYLLVLGSANVDEALRGYFTKYDCSSADLNPIGSISKVDLKKLLTWAGQRYKWPALEEIGLAPPTAELRPIKEGTDLDAEHTQGDEEEMGMTYQELSVYGKLRKISMCGPVSMFKKLLSLWSHLDPKEIGDKVKRFFYYHSVNRHKMTTLTPSYHAEQYSPDDNRYDLRPFLYNTKWTRQFGNMDALVDHLAATHTTRSDGAAHD